MSETLFENGLGYVLVSRFKAGGAVVETGVFMVDAWCLGVKDCFFTEQSKFGYEEKVVQRISDRYPLKKVEPAYARKLVEDAVAYAYHLGFSPHRDYKKACRVFGGIDAGTCTESFTFGKDGKPCYVRGPNETQEQAEKIIAHLQRVCGEDNYHFLMALGEAKDISRAMGVDETGEEAEA